MVQSHAVPLADTPAAASTDEGLVRVLGVKSATLFVLGSVIGSGIFLTTGSMAAALPSATLLLTAWTLGGVIALTGGLSYAELGSMFPQSGGVYVYLREAFGPLVAFLYGWAAFLVFWSGGLAAVAVGFAEYLSYFFPALSSSRIIVSVHTIAGTWTVSAASVVAVAALVALAAINYIGVRSGNFANIVLTIAKIAGLASLPLLALFFAKTSPAWTPV